MFVYQYIRDDIYNQPHMFMMNNYAKLREACDWGRQMFGPAVLGERWTYGGASVWFRDERDAFEFRLRWC